MDNCTYSDASPSYSYISDIKSSYSSISYETIGTSTCQQTEEQLINFQTEILQQVQQIDLYVNKKNQNTKKKSQSFLALQQLYSLFKQELQLNFSIRKALVQEKKFNEQATIQCANAKNQITHFLAKISKQTGIEFSSLKQVTDHLSDILTVRRQRANINSVQGENIKLMKKIESLNNEIEELQAQKAVEVAEMQARIDLESSKSDELISKIKELQANRDESMQSVLINKQREFEQISEHFRQIQAKNIKELADTQEKLAQKTNLANKLNHDVELMQKELEVVKKERDELRGNSANIELLNKYKEDLRNIENALESKQKETKKLRKERNALIRCINEQKVIHDASIHRIDELQEKLMTIEAKYKQIARQRRASSVHVNYQSKRNIQKDRFGSIDPRLYTENKNMHNELVRALSDIRRLEDENSILSRKLDMLQRDMQDPAYMRYSIIEAFNTLRNGLGLGLQASPDTVVQFILDSLNRRGTYNDTFQNDSLQNDTHSFSESSYGSQSVATNEFQAQIDSLQNEVLSLKGEVAKFTQ